MSLREASEKLKERSEELKNEVKSTVRNIGESLPRPIRERPTIILRESVLSRVRRRLEKKQR